MTLRAGLAGGAGRDLAREPTACGKALGLTGEWAGALSHCHSLAEFAVRGGGCS